MPRLRIVNIGEPFDFQRHISQATEVGCAQKSLAGGTVAGRSAALMALGYIIDNVFYQ
jgi:hypothetical protein